MWSAPHPVIEAKKARYARRAFESMSACRRFRGGDIGRGLVRVRSDGMGDLEGCDDTAICLPYHHPLWYAREEDALHARLGRLV